MSNPAWWRNAAIYQVYPRSFQDSNGDGEGDLRGVIARLDYLRGLGVDAIWLCPFYTSPNRDGGYDVADPRDVDPRFGDLADVQRLIDGAHDAGLRVIVDVVPNHFSVDHAWFQEALRAPRNSPARSRFHFHEGRGPHGELPPNNWHSIFGGPAWTRVVEHDGSAGQWYLHLFDSSQADLNWEHAEVQADFVQTLRFWLDRGVDGFRIDVAHGLVKESLLEDHRDPAGLMRALRLDLSDVSPQEREALLGDVPFFDREGVHAIYRRWRQLLDAYPGERMAVAEAWVHPGSRAARYVRRDELHQIFNFDFLIAPWEASSLVSAIERTLGDVREVGAPPTWVLSNHDSPRLVSRLGGGATGERRARAFALLTQALPGGTYIYQGEELGLADGDLPDDARQDPVFFRTGGAEKGRDGARIPLPWDGGENFGFTTGEPWLPIPAEWNARTVASQSETPGSFLNFYRTSLRLRREHPALQPSADDALTWLATPAGTLGFRREPGFALYANASSAGVRIRVAEGWSLLHASADGVRLDGNLLELPGDTTCWLASRDLLRGDRGPGRGAAE